MSVCFAYELVNFLSFCLSGGKLVIDVPFPLKGFNFDRILIISVATAEIKMLAEAAKETPSLGSVSFHIVGLPALCTVSVIGKNPMLFAVFWRISVRFSDPPYVSVKSKLQHPLRAYPGHLTSFLAGREGI